jgi:hypothetical protein
MKTAPSKNVLVGACADAMERILRDQLELHRNLLQCIARKKHAIRTADIASVTKICGEENGIVQRLAESEKQRLALVGKLTQFINPKAQTPLTIVDIASLSPEPQRSRTVVLAAQLREILQQVQRESSIVKNAAETLSRHMSGIMQTVHAALSRARVYGHRGRIAVGAQMPSVLDIKS